MRCSGIVYKSTSYASDSTTAEYPFHLTDDCKLDPFRALTSISTSALNPIISTINPMSKSNDRPTPQYPLICFTYESDRILLPHTKTLEETTKLLRYYLNLPKDEDIELTTKWSNHSVRIVSHVWPYIGGAVEDIKVTTFEKSPLSP
ncbi:hypothetical protein PIIN_06947 [Serendipita indica DSM 11827]|uniref:Uncharacterized protein n=1 Tax=Serendipita indica (strain DSM 11827) TaxID=1109443 RepID=G4TNU9_SERID|nr:hypothetical protein PIIN_06947 [Serendipita indica DSM 11827]